MKYHASGGGFFADLLRVACLLEKTQARFCRQPDGVLDWV